MHYRRLACLLLGFWLAGSVFMMVVATHNFAGVDELLASPSARASKDVKVLGQPEARLLMRHLVSELNRWYFDHWEKLQLAIGMVLLLALFFGADARSSWLLMTLLILVVTGVQHWLLTPQIIRLGRVLDFSAAGLDTEQHRFWAMHSAYSTIEVIKLVLGSILTLKLLFRRRRRTAELGDEIDRVDDADDRHVDGR